MILCSLRSCLEMQPQEEEDSSQRAAIVVVVSTGADALLHTITSTATGNAHLSPCTLSREGKKKFEFL